MISKQPVMRTVTIAKRPAPRKHTRDERTPPGGGKVRQERGLWVVKEPHNLHEIADAAGASFGSVLRVVPQLELDGGDVCVFSQ